MRAHRGSLRGLALAAGATSLCCGFASAPLAQVGSFGGIGGPSLTQSSVITGRADAFAGPSRDYSALPVGDWLLYPTLFAGAIYDTNVDQAPSGRSSPGARLVPSLLAETTNGLLKSTLYGMADGRLYTRGSGNTLAARAGVIENYQGLPDLNFYAQGDYTRQKDLFSTFGIDHSVTTLNPTAIGLSPVVNPLTYNQGSVTATVQKNFDRAFVNFGASVVDIFYDTNPLLLAPSPNGITYTGVARGGFWFTPFLYAYTEGSADQRRFNNDMFNSFGYRTVAGIGSDQIGLFRGEVYGGYQSQK